VVNFWAATCAPCVGEMPALEKLYVEYRDRVTFVGIDTAESIYAGRAMAKTTGVTYLLATDPSGHIVRSIGAFGLPTTVVLDRTGTVAHVKAQGATRPAQLRDWLDQVLK
jgi:cytochrome c biogenesis protein CcmG, thiol:disulfide interchange protein DsbE